MSVKKTYI